MRDSLRTAAANVYAVARAELERLERPATAELPQGQRVEVVSAPVASAGVYAPGGRGVYPSSVLMCCLPALAAGVSRIVVVTPPGGEGRPSDVVLAACAICRVEEVYAVGGAQAIAALAHGTDTIDPVDVVVGPGNRYVTEAKRAVSGLVGIDGIAGPSELVIVADGTAPPQALALDLCAQAEHGDDTLLALISHNAALLDDVAERVAALAAERPSVADAPLALITAPGLQRALELADALAPEHLELAFDGADEASARGRVAGCVFVGSGGATAFGDYAAGSNHVLPTGGAARFGGPARAGRVHAPDVGGLHRLVGGARIGARRRGAVPGRGVRSPRRVRDGEDEAMSDGPTARQARIERETRETKISLELDLGGGEVAPETGIGFFDHMLELLGRHANVGLVGPRERRPRDRRAPHGRGRRDRARPGARPGARRPFRHPPLRARRRADGREPRRVRDRRLGAPVLPL